MGGAHVGQSRGRTCLRLSHPRAPAPTSPMGGARGGDGGGGGGCGQQGMDGLGYGYVCTFVRVLVGVCMSAALLTCVSVSVSLCVYQ